MRSIILAAGALVLLASPSFAQIATSGAAAQAGSAIIQSIVVPGGGAGGGGVNNNVGTLSNPQFLMGQSTIGPSVMSYDACSRSRSGSILSVGAGWTQTDEDCARQRQAGFAKDIGAPVVAYEHMCKIKEFADSDAKTLRQCYDTKMADAKARSSSNAPIAPATRVSAGHGLVVTECYDTAGRRVPEGTRGASCGSTFSN